MERFFEEVEREYEERNKKESRLTAKNKVGDKQNQGQMAGLGN